MRKIFLYLAVLILSLTAGCSNKPETDSIPSASVKKPPTSSVTEPFIPKTSKTTIVDLDGDNVQDTVMFSLDAMSFDRYLITVNNCSLICQGSSVSDSILIIDIDTADVFKEIAVGGGEPDDSYLTAIYWYNGNKIDSVGIVEEEYSEYMIPGNRKISTTKRTDFLGTHGYRVTCYLEPDHKLYEMPEKWTEEDIELTLKTTIPLWRYINDSNPKIQLKEGDKIVVLVSDRERACLVETSKGKRGWLIVGKNGKVNGTEYGLDQAFDGIHYAN